MPCPHSLCDGTEEWCRDWGSEICCACGSWQLTEVILGDAQCSGSAYCGSGIGDGSLHFLRHCIPADRIQSVLGCVALCYVKQNPQVGGWDSDVRHWCFPKLLSRNFLSPRSKAAGPIITYTTSLNLNTKVLDFVKSGGPTCTELFANFSIGRRLMTNRREFCITCASPRGGGAAHGRSAITPSRAHHRPCSPVLHRVVVLPNRDLLERVSP